MSKRIGFVSAVVAVLLMLFASVATAAEPHFIRSAASGPDAAGNLASASRSRALETMSR